MSKENRGTFDRVSDLWHTASDLAKLTLYLGPSFLFLTFTDGNGRVIKKKRTGKMVRDGIKKEWTLLPGSKLGTGGKVAVWESRQRENLHEHGKEYVYVEGSMTVSTVGVGDKITLPNGNELSGS